jgi:hypothetical protein
MEIVVAVVCPRSGRPPDHIDPGEDLVSGGRSLGTIAGGNGSDHSLSGVGGNDECRLGGDGGTTSGWEIIDEGRTHDWISP